MQCQEMPLAVERKLGMGEMVACLVVGDKALRPRGGPAHRTAQAARRPGDQPLLGVDLAFVAEAAAHIGRDHAQLALGDAELLGHLLTDVMGRLRGGIEREAVGARIDRGDHRARLDRATDQAIVDEIERDLVRSGLERLAHRGLVAARPAEADIAGRGLVQLRRAWHQRGTHVGHGGQRLVVDTDQLGRILGLRQSLGDDDRDRLAVVAHGLARERVARRLHHRRSIAGADDPERPHRRDAVRGHVDTGEDRGDAGRRARRRSVDLADARMGVRRADDGAVERAGQIDVGDETALAEQETAILDAADRRADALVVGEVGTIHRINPHS
jgi:hypothetical protein